MNSKPTRGEILTVSRHEWKDRICVAEKQWMYIVNVMYKLLLLHFCLSVYLALLDNLRMACHRWNPFFVDFYHGMQRARCRYSTTNATAQWKKEKNERCEQNELQSRQCLLTIELAIF